VCGGDYPLFTSMRQAKAMLEPTEGGKSAILPQVVAVIGAKLEEEGVATGTAGLVAGGGQLATALSFSWFWYDLQCNVHDGVVRWCCRCC
jgi:hypothetical protein